ncbi:SdpI family protein [Actinophytocola xanthii]|uniref:SdpI family protein n=1 Tax=Actinophytocola xanthii TaxID=1912961 RepID=A0A1Q8CVC5_9PSEU|nr:SdpI family protein [Actinophytocola xanthii]OLF18286.1 hypothetical protein BU204_06935 [Actinophytocola xanthii]
MHLLALVPLVVGSALVVVGLLGLLERLPRNRFVGVRTPATLRSDRAFLVANKVAGLPVAVAGAVGVASGALGLLASSLVLAAVGFAGLVGIAVAGGMLGHRAGEAVPDEKPAQERALPDGCRGCACGGCEISRSVGSDVTRVGGE